LKKQLQSLLFYTNLEQLGYLLAFPGNI